MPHRWMLLCGNVLKFVLWEIFEIMRYLHEKNSIASQTVATAQIAPKICQGQPQQCAHSAPDFIKVRSLPAE